MSQRERDRLVALHKARKRLITQRQAEELGLSERQVRRPSSPAPCPRADLSAAPSIPARRSATLARPRAM